jgi:hypothetical protein
VGGIRVISEFNGAYLLEVEGCGGTFRVAPTMPGQRRNYGVWWEPCEPDTERLFEIYNRAGEWHSHTTHNVDLLAVVRHELAWRGFLGEEAMHATGLHRPVYRW